MKQSIRCKVQLLFCYNVGSQSNCWGFNSCNAGSRERQRSRTSMSSTKLPTLWYVSLPKLDLDLCLLLPESINLGIPGCGKTLLPRYFANIFGIPLIPISISNVLSMWQGKLVDDQSFFQDKSQNQSIHFRSESTKVNTSFSIFLLFFQHNWADIANCHL